MSPLLQLERLSSLSLMTFIQGQELHLHTLARTEDCVSQRERKEKEEKEGRKKEPADLIWKQRGLISTFAVEDPPPGSKGMFWEPCTDAITTTAPPAAAPRQFLEG